MSADLPHRVVFRDEWLAARRAHLKNEKALTRLRDLVIAERRTLPWVRVEKTYVFDSDQGPRQLLDLFGGCRQLVVHHLMFHQTGTPRAPAARSRPNTSMGRCRTSSARMCGSWRSPARGRQSCARTGSAAAGQVYHTYSTYARGLDDLLGANHYLDLTPPGRNEAAFPDWPPRRDEYQSD
jgi:predicted dithiol-disulfide oxidoreductase (DUF899 family)